MSLTQEFPLSSAQSTPGTSGAGTLQTPGTADTELHCLCQTGFIQTSLTSPILAQLHQKLKHLLTVPLSSSISSFSNFIKEHFFIQ